MKRRSTDIHRSCAGFSLVEALVATALMGIVLAGLATLTAQWLPNWDRGFTQIQRAETLGIALDRLVADISASEFIVPNRESKRPMFDGTEFGVAFVRTSIGPNTRPGLDVVRIAETIDDRGRVLVRSRVPFAPLPTNTIAISQLKFSDPVALIRAPYRVSFAYAGRDGAFRDTWQNADDLPAAVRLVVREITTDRTLAVSTAAMIHVEMPASATCAKTDDGCGAPSTPSGNGSTSSRRG